MSGAPDIACVRWVPETGKKVFTLANLPINGQRCPVHRTAPKTVGGSGMQVITEEQRQERRAMFERADQERAEREQKKRRENRNFVQVYPKGFQRIRTLMDQNPLAARVYAFLAEHIEEGTGTVVASQELLAEEMGVSERSIRRATTYLDECGAVLRIKIGGAIYAYALDPEEIWKSWDESKKYAAFRTKTLARKRDNGDVKRKLQIMVSGQQELFSEPKSN